jgi:aldose 1-epimerase
MRFTAGSAELVLAPEMGGAVVSWTIAGRPIFRDANPAATVSREHACYPLVPFSNRVGGRAFSFNGARYTLPALIGEWAIHGAGWQCAWQLAGDMMTLDYPGGELWPFAFQASQRFELAADSLTVTMRLTNRHHDVAPAAIGLHPFFHRDADSALQTSAGSVWLAGQDQIPTHAAAVPAEWDFSTTRAIADAAIDHCFSGWSGEALLTWPERREFVRIVATSPLQHLVLYVPRGQNFIAIEPVSNMTDGLNHMNTNDDHGMAVLAPGWSLEGSITMTMEALT